jgi:hypothetical protein
MAEQGISLGRRLISEVHYWGKVRWRHHIARHFRDNAEERGKPICEFQTQ